MPNYPVHEIFESFQGEGEHMGRRAVFVRLYGCDQKCPWCDSAGTWHKDYIPTRIERLSHVDIANIVSWADADFVVLTGGEPALYDLQPIIDASPLPVHLETAGHQDIRGFPDWVTMSPKLFDGAKPVVKSNLELTAEIKFIIERPSDIQRAVQWMNEYEVKPHGMPIWLHPEWGHRNDPDVLMAITKAVRMFGFRAGWQLHKLYKADLLDERARSEIVPLGGDPKRGPSA